MSDKIDFSSNELIRLYNQLKDLGVTIWLDGGWGVDSLLGIQTRSHSDLDIIIQQKDICVLRALLKNKVILILNEMIRLTGTLSWLIVKITMLMFMLLSLMTI